MPIAFKHAGLYFGLISTLLIGLICVHCMHTLIGCANVLCKRLRYPSMSYDAVTFNALRSGPERIRRYAPIAGHMLNTFLCITQIGGCSVYFVFIAVNLNQFINHYSGQDVSIKYILIAMLIPMILINFLKNLKYLAPVSLIASGLTVTGK